MRTQGFKSEGWQFEKKKNQTYDESWFQVGVSTEQVTVCITSLPCLEL